MSLHCGACNTEFDTGDQLTEHLTTCKAANAIRFPITMLMLGMNDASHHIAHLCYSIPKSHHHLVRYAQHVAADGDSLQRAELHSRLCKSLGLDYSEFRPFESETITKIPSCDEAISIIYGEIKKIINKKMYA